MKKNIFYTAVLLLAGTMMTACSGGDDVTSDITPVSQPAAEAGDVVELSGTLGSKGDVTRAIASNGTGTWAVGDQFAVYYETTNGNASTVATVNSVNDDKSANFTASLHSPKAGDNSVKLVYPASAHDGQGGFKTDALMKQGGTLEYINKNGLDIETAATTMSVEGMTAKLTSEVTLQPQVCLYTMSLRDDYSQSLSATKLEINDGTHNYTITPAAATNTFTVALLPVEDANFTFNALTRKEGKIYTKQNVTLATCTPANVGHVIDENGDIYEVSDGSIIYGASFNNITLNIGKFYGQNLKLHLTTPVAMIAYVGENGSVETSSTYRGLAIAMSDCTKYNCSVMIPDFYGTSWCNQNSTTCTSHVSDEISVARGWKDGISMTSSLVSKEGHTHNAAKAARTYNRPCPTTSGWFLPSLGQWQLILQGLITKAGYQPDLISTSTSENEKLNRNLYYPILQNAGTEFSNCYWSSSEHSANNGWGIDTEHGVALSTKSKTAFDYHVRPVLAF